MMLRSLYFALVAAVVYSLPFRAMKRHSACLLAKKGGAGSGMMPTADELAALNKVLDGEIEWGDLDDWADPGGYDVPVNALNTPPPSKQGEKRSMSAHPNEESPTLRKKPALRGPPKKATPLKKPNSDWRNSASRKAANAPGPPEAADFIEDFDMEPEATSQSNAVDDLYAGGGGDIDDLGYDDFERAFAELSQGGLNPGGGGSKRSRLVEEHPGLVSGQVVKGGVWPNLVQPDGESTRFSRIHKDLADIVVLYAAPRRVNDELKTVLREFSKLPMAKMKIAAVAVNTDDSNDQRKLVKKMGGGGTLPYSLLSDPTGILMEALCCKLPGRSVSVLMILAVNKGSADTSNADATILRVMYQGAWDPVATKDIVVEEIEEYRQNPTAYLQGQIGIM
jgi:hypothetical protein